MKLRVAVVAVLFFAASIAAARTRAVSRGSGVPTFSREVVRIFQQNCQQCHHSGGIAPFSLVDYQSARPYALQIKLATATRKMPPWKPIDGCGEFVGARRLSSDTVDTIRRWVDAGAPEGDPSGLPLPLEFSTEWNLGVPDLVVAPTEAYVPPQEGDTFRCFVLPIQFSSDTYVTAFDVHPARELVHHIEVFLDTTGKAKQLDDADPEPGFDLFAGGLEIPFGLLGAWLPGAEPFILPDRVAFKIPSEAAIVLQVHYHPAEHPTRPDRAELALYLAKTPIEKVARTASFYVGHIAIPAGAQGFVVQTSGAINEAVEVYGIRAHMHFLGRSIAASADDPDGGHQCLVNIDDWDIHWQDVYRYRTPVQLPAGTIIRVTGSYDNPLDHAVFGGPRATDEMCGVELVYAPAAEHLFIIP